MKLVGGVRTRVRCRAALVAAATTLGILGSAIGPSVGAAVSHESSGKHVFRFASVTKATIEGYSYKVSIKFTEGPASMGNAESLPPGWYVVDLPVSGSVTVTNTTPGRIAPDPSLGNTAIAGLWKVPSPLCTQPNLDGTGPGISPDAVHDVIGSTWYCNADTMAFIEDNTPGATLRPGRSVTYPLQANECESTVNGNSCPSVQPAHANSFVYTKQWVSKVLDVLKTKPPVVVAYWNKDSQGAHTACTGDSGASSDTVWVISSSTRLANTCS